MHNYRKQMYAKWLEPTQQEQLLQAAAKEYHAVCDAYDQRVCTGISPRTGEPLPASPDQQRAINAYSYQVRKDILARYGITEAELHKAIIDYRREA